MAVRY